MTLTDWILALHVLSAFALVAGMTALWALVLATRAEPGLPGSVPEALARPAVAALIGGIFGTVVFGIWLAIDVEAYHPWDPWIVASLILWVVVSALGSQSGAAFRRVSAGGPDAREWWSRGVRLQAGASAAALVVLILMIWKPGSVSVLAAIRPGDVNIALFVHVLGAMLLVGTLLAASTALLLAWRRADPDEAQALTRFGLRVLLIGVLPSYVVMRIGAQWTQSAEDLPDEFDPTWLSIGFVTADGGALVLIISTVLSAMGLRRLRFGRGLGFGRAVGVLSTILLAAYVVAVWAMSAKPD